MRGHRDKPGDDGHELRPLLRLFALLLLHVGAEHRVHAPLIAGAFGFEVKCLAYRWHLADARLRSAAIEALAAFGPRVVGALGDVLEDESVAIAIRQHVPRALRLIRDQRSVDVLLRAIAQRDLTVRSAALRALNRLRESAPGLDYGSAALPGHMEDEARRCFELKALLTPFRDASDRRTAVGLLAGTLEERLVRSLERLFRLLGLRYPPKEIYATYLAVQRRRDQELSTALDFLDGIVDRDVKRYLMPLLDSSDQGRRGHELFGIGEKDAVAALRELIRSGDPWLAACAVAAAAELGLRGLIPEIREARGAGAEVRLVAERAMAALA